MAKRRRSIGVLSGLVLVLIAATAASALAATGAEVAALPLRDSLKRSENPLSNSSKWVGNKWSGSSPAAGVDTTTGWHPSSSTTLQGATWSPNSFSEPNAASVVAAIAPSTSDYNMLWVDLPTTSATTPSGYQLTWTLGSKSKYAVQLLKISSGTETVLGSASATITAGTTIALSDNGSTLTVWTGSGGTLTELMTKSDSTYSGGYAAIEGGGSTGKLTEFKAGHLVAAPTFTWTAPLSPAANTSPKIAGAAESGSTVKLFTNSSCSGSPVASGTAAAFASPGIPTTVTANTTTNYYATATDASGDVSPCSTTHGIYQNDASEILIEGSELEDFYVQQCVAGRVDEVADPLGSGRTVMSFEPHSTDVVSNSECEKGGAPTENPRAQAIAGNIEPGTEFWLRARFLIPNSFPLITGNSWLTLIDLYGAPFEGPAPWNFAVKPLNIEGTYYGDAFMHQRNASYEYDIPWFEELGTGKWNEVLLHEKFAEKGWVEEWFDGVQEKFFVPELSLYNPLKEKETTKLEMKTRDFSNGAGSNAVHIGQYRQAEEFTPTPTYFEFVKAGKTKASVGG